jgi:hypothetical protein
VGCAQQVEALCEPRARGRVVPTRERGYAAAGQRDGERHWLAGLAQQGQRLVGQRRRARHIAAAKDLHGQELQRQSEVQGGIGRASELDAPGQGRRGKRVVALRPGEDAQAEQRPSARS